MPSQKPTEDASGASKASTTSTASSANAHKPNTAGAAGAAKAAKGASNTPKGSTPLAKTAEPPATVAGAAKASDPKAGKVAANAPKADAAPLTKTAKPPATVAGAAKASDPKAAKISTKTPKAGTPSTGPPKKTPGPPTGSANTGTGGPSTSNPTPVAWDIERFSLSKTTSGQHHTEYTPDSVEFRLVADAYHIAIKAFRRKDTQNELEALGKECVAAWTSPMTRKKYKNFKWEGETSMMANYVKTYSDAVMYTPPAIYVDLDVGDDAYADATREKSYNGNYEILRTRELFYIRISPQEIDGLKEAYASKDDDRYQKLQPWVDDAITVRYGESGYFMEGKIWGGAVHMGKNIYVQDCNDEKKPIDIETVRAFLQHPESYNLKKCIEAAKPFKSSKPPAKRQKVSHDTNLGPRRRLAAWNVRFTYNANHVPISLDKEMVAVA